MVSREYATSSVIGSFFIVSATGLLMFFHVKSGAIENLHSWMGILFLAAGLLHVGVNLRAFKKYFQKRKTVLVMVAIALLGVVLFTTAPEKQRGKGRGLALHQAKLEVGSLSGPRR